MPSPSAATTPENSWPSVTGAVSPVQDVGVSGVGQKIGPSRYSCRSVPQIPQKATSMSTSPAPAVGSSISSMRMSLLP